MAPGPAGGSTRFTACCTGSGVAWLPKTIRRAHALIDANMAQEHSNRRAGHALVAGLRLSVTV